jgi:predicted RNase H-like HicB family nuclease
MKKIEVIIEKQDSYFFVRVEGKGNYMPNGYGPTPKDAINNLKEIILDYQVNEGKEDKFWKKIDIKAIELELHYDMQAFFEEHDFLNITAIAKRSGINPALVRQYASGVKHPSAEQSRKLLGTIHQLGEQLQTISLYA